MIGSFSFGQALGAMPRDERPREDLPSPDESASAAAPPTAWRAVCSFREGHWYVRWRPLHKPEGIDCRIDRFGARREHLSAAA
jgi:hypothetical protein